MRRSRETRLAFNAQDHAPLAKHQTVGDLDHGSAILMAPHEHLTKCSSIYPARVL